MQKRKNRKANSLPKLTATQRYERNTNTLKGRLNRLVIGARASAKDKGYTFNIDRNDMLTIWENQGGVCTYTGWKMEPQTKSKRLVSIDRIDSSIGYEKGNIQLTCWCVNRAKSFMGEDEFREMCKAIASQSQKNFDF
jgi:hypothetical protein